MVQIHGIVDEVEKPDYSSEASEDLSVHRNDNNRIHKRLYLWVIIYFSLKVWNHNCGLQEIIIFIASFDSFYFLNYNNLSITYEVSIIHIHMYDIIIIIVNVVKPVLTIVVWTIRIINIVDSETHWYWPKVVETETFSEVLLFSGWGQTLEQDQCKRNFFDQQHHQQQWESCNTSSGRAL